MVKKQRKNSILNEFTVKALVVIGIMGGGIVVFVCLIVRFFGVLFDMVTKQLQYGG